MMKHSLFVPLLFLAIGCGEPGQDPAPETKPDPVESKPVTKTAPAVKPEIRYYAFAG